MTRKTRGRREVPRPSISEFGAKQNCSFPGVTGVVHRYGRLCWRYRGDGFSCYLPGDYDSAEFRAAYAAALTKRLPATPGTFKHLIYMYMQSPKYLDLAESTRRDLDRRLERLQNEIGDLMADCFEPRHVEQLIMRKRDQPNAANKIRQILSTLYNFGLTIGQVSHNPVQHVPRLRAEVNHEMDWTDTEIERYRQFWGSGTQARLAMELALSTFGRPQDLVRLGWPNVQGSRISYLRGGTHILVSLQISPELATELLHVAGGSASFLAQSGGRPYAPASLGKWFRKRCMDAGLPPRNLRGLRVWNAIRAVKAGATESELASVLGLKNLGRDMWTMLVRPDRVRLSDSVFAKLESMKQEQGMSHRPGGLDTKSRKPLR
jgi:integrase